VCNRIRPVSALQGVDLSGRVNQGLILGAPAGLFEDSQRQCPRLGAMDFHATAGLEAGPLQPVTAEPDLRFDLASPEIAGGFDLQCSCDHLKSVNRFQQVPGGGDPGF